MKPDYADIARRMNKILDEAKVELAKLRITHEEYGLKWYNGKLEVKFNGQWWLVFADHLPLEARATAAQWVGAFIDAAVAATGKRDRRIAEVADLAERAWADRRKVKQSSAAGRVEDPTPAERNKSEVARG